MNNYSPFKVFIITTCLCILCWSIVRTCNTYYILKEKKNREASESLLITEAFPKTSNLINTQIKDDTELVTLQYKL